MTEYFNKAHNFLKIVTNKALLLGHALLGKIGDGHEGQQNLQVLLEVVRGVEIVAGHGVGGSLSHAIYHWCQWLSAN